MTHISKFLREKNITLYNWILCKRIAPERCNWSLRLDVPVNKQLSKSTAWKGHGLMKNAPTYNTTTTVFKIKKGKDMFHSKKKARTWWNLRYLRAWWLCSHESYTTWYWNQKKKRIWRTKNILPPHSFEWLHILVHTNTKQWWL